VAGADVSEVVEGDAVEEDVGGGFAVQACDQGVGGDGDGGVDLAADDGDVGGAAGDVDRAGGGDVVQGDGVGGGECFPDSGDVLEGDVAAADCELGDGDAAGGAEDDVGAGFGRVGGDRLGAIATGRDLDGLAGAGAVIGVVERCTGSGLGAGVCVGAAGCDREGATGRRCRGAGRAGARFRGEGGLSG